MAVLSSLLILFFVGRRYVVQHLNLERIVRGQLIPQIEKQLGRRVEIGRIETDYQSQVVLHDVVIGRETNRSNPIGALARAKTVRLQLALIPLALGRSSVEAALRGVDIEALQLFVQRDTLGRINLLQGIKSSGSGKPTPIFATINWRDGRVFYQDLGVRSSEQMPLRADARGVSGSALLEGFAPATFGAIARSIVAEDGTRAARPIQLATVSARGKIGLDGQRAETSIALPPTPAVFLSRYVFPTRDIVGQAGTLRGALLVQYNDKARGNERLHFAGEMQAHDVAGFAQALRAPTDNRPIRIEAFNGPLSIRDRALFLHDATLRLPLLNAKLRLNGSLALLQTPAFDLRARADALDARRLQNVLRGAVPELKNFDLNAGPVRADIRATGDARAISLAGTLDAPRVGVRGKGAQMGASRAQIALRARLSGPSARLEAQMTLPDFALHAPNSALQSLDAPLMNARLSLQNGARGTTLIRFQAANPRLTGRASAQNGSLSANTARGVLSLSGRDAGGEVELQNVSGEASKYGSFRAATLSLRGTTPDLARPIVAGQASVAGLDASRLNRAALGLSGLQVRSLGSIGAQARFAGLGSSQPMARGSFALSGATLRDVVLRVVNGQISLGGGRLRLANARAQSTFGPLVVDAEAKQAAGGFEVSRFALTAPRLVLDARRLNPFLQAQGVRLRGRAVGRVTLISTSGVPPLPGHDLSPRALDGLQTSFDLALPEAFLNAARQKIGAHVVGGRLRGGGRLSLHGGRWQLTGQSALSAPRAEISVPDAGGRVRLQNIRLKASGTLNSQSGALPLLTGELRAEQVVSSQWQAAGRGAPLNAVRAAFLIGPDGVRVPRLSARTLGGSLTGHAALNSHGLSGQLLAQDFSAARLIQFVPSLPLQARGTTFAQIDFDTARAAKPGGFGARVQARLYNGALSGVLNGKSVALPVDFARADFDVNANSRIIPLHDAALWSRGARVQANGLVRLTSGTPNLDLQAQVSGVRIREAARLAGLSVPPQSADLDGLGSGVLRISGGAARPTISGSVGLRLASVSGLPIQNATAQLDFRPTNRGPQFSLRAIKGEAGAAAVSPFEGSLAADFAANAWSLDLKAGGIPTRRLVRLARQNVSFKGAETDIPLRGEVGADLHLRGSLQDARGRLALRPMNGTASVQTSVLRWRGRRVGALTADLVLTGGILRARAIRLGPTEAEASNAQAESGVSPFVLLTGELPLSVDAPGLNAQISAGNGRLSLILAAGHELRDTLRASGQPPSILDTLLLNAERLPELEGNVTLNAAITGRWDDPAINVETIQIQNARARTVLGDVRPLPSLNASFSYHDGAFDLRPSELRLAALPVEGHTADPDDDTLLRLSGGRVEMGGPVSLEADLLNANLSQLAPWVPALRDVDGAPLLRGELAQFAFSVEGTTEAPSVIGSLQAQNLDYRGYTLDRLRVASFSIAEGFLRVKKGNLTVVKGGFQSDVGEGMIPWDWSAPGPSRTRPLQIRLPLQKVDFGALTGVLAPAITNVDADDFSGSVDIGGTLDAPLLAGSATLRRARFRLDAAAFPLRAGVSDLSGTLRFDGNRLQIDPADILRGRLVTAESVQAPSTGNRPASERDPRAALRQARLNAPPPGNLQGAFEVRGSVALDLQNLAGGALLQPRQALADQRFDLQLGFRDGTYTTTGFSGLREINGGVLWRTGDGEPRQSQTLRWMLSARGATRRSSKSASGQLVSLAALRLAPNFANSLDTLLHSRALSFSAPDEIEALRTLPVFAPVWAKLPPEERADLRPRLSLRRFAFDARDVGRGLLDGALTFDNRPATPPAPLLPVRPTLAALQTVPEDKSRIRALQDEADGASSGSAGFTPPIRVTGGVSLSGAQLIGLPSSEASGTVVEWPAAPVFDATLNLGRDVQFTTSTLRAELQGALAIGGTPRTPLIVGAISTRSGQVRFPNAAARITNGELQVAIARDAVTGALRPRVEIDASARGRSGRYLIDLTLRGPLDFGAGNAQTQNLRVDVTSNPPLSQDEAFAQLLGTNALDAAGTLSTGRSEAYAKAIVNLVSAPFFSGLERSLERSLGLSSIVLDYRFNEPLAVEVGKAVGDRVYVSYRRSIGAIAVGPTPYTVRVEYRIKGNLQLGVQTDERNRRQLTLQKTFRF